MHVFDQALQLEHAGEHRYRGQTHPAYANMVGPFGGVSAAQLLQSVLQHPQRLGDPAALTVNFCAPVADGAFLIEAQPVRTNRSTQHWTVQMVQGDSTVLSATVMTALRRPSFSLVEHAMPQVPPAQAVPVAQTRGRPAWTTLYEMRPIDGGIPQAWDGRDSGGSRSRLWMRDSTERPLDYPSLTAFADLFFPRVFLRRATVVPAGTVTMTVYFLADAAQIAAVGSAPVLGQAQAQRMHMNYLDQSGQLWNVAGELLATTHQLMYYRE
jgi:acyl-CoA thioesterase